MSARRTRMTRRIRNGGVLDEIPTGAVLKGGPITVNGAQFVELLDGRIVRYKVKRLVWTGKKFVTESV